MKILNITDDYETEINIIQFIDDESDNINFILKLLLLSIPGDVLLITLIGFMIWIIPKLLFNIK